MAHCKVLFGVLGTTCLLYAQDSRGSITGRVTDQSAAVMSGVRVRAVNEATQVATSATSNDSGNFVIPFLSPGPYTVTAETTGFKKFSRPNVQVRISEVAEINIPMTIGTVDETVTVSATAPLLDTAEASLGQVVDEKRIQNLPLFAGNPHELMFISPGVANSSNTMPQQYAPWNGVQVQSNGNGSNSNDFSIDGVPNTFPNGVSRGVRPAFSPPTAAVSEFRIETASYDASVGHSIGASVNVNTKGGTNEFHGGAHWYLKNSALDAPSFFDNMAGRKLEPYRYNRAGFDLGGPVKLPGYNGRNQTFFFYTYERNIWSVPEPRTDTVPTLKQRQGDFSELLALGSRYQIYDPFSAAPAPNGRIVRAPFPNNIIPAHLIDPVGKALVSYYPEPNLAGTSDGQLNYHTPAVATQDYFVHLARIDHAFNETNRVFVRLDWASWDEDQLRRLGRTNPASGLLTTSRDRGAAFDFVRILGAGTVLNFRYGATFQRRADYRASRGWDLASMGFSQRFVGLIDSQYATIPEVVPDSYARISRFWSGSGDGSNTGLVHSVNANVTHMLRQHQIKVGTSFRGNRSFGNRFPYSTSPYFRFSSTYTRGPFDNSAASPMGQDLAAMLLGLPSDSSLMEHSPSFALNGPSIGLYVQDTYKVTRRLTLNLGLRWEYDFPVTERYNRLVAQFDPTTPNPVDAAARANYARNPIAEIAPGNFRALGGLTWVNRDNRSPFTTSAHNFMPRIGLAFQLTPKTVVRGGYGMYFDTVAVNQTVPIQMGFGQSTPIQPSLDGGLTFIARASDPFPNAMIPPLGAGGGLATNLSQSLSFFNELRKNPYAQRWSLGVQRLLPGDFLVEATYVGNRGTRLEIPRNINGVPNSYLSTSFSRDQPRIDHLTQRVPNPFAGTDPIFASTVPRLDLLRPWPQFGNIIVDDNAGYSWYHAMQLRTEKRLSAGFTFQGAYTWSKLMQATEFLNAADPMPYETISGTDRPHIVSLTGLWEMPFGRGRRIGSNMHSVVNGFLGGWELGLIFRHQTGTPLEFGDAIFNGDIKSIPLSSSERSPERWFNVDSGFNRVAAQQRSHNVRAFPLRFNSVRGDAQRRWDVSLMKTFAVTERARLEFRAEAVNAPNSPIFGLPNTTPSSSSFGRVSSLAWSGRQLQFALRLRF